MQIFKVSPLELVSSIWRSRQLIGTLVARDVVGRYQGSMLGLLWSFFNPLLMLAVYTFVFGVVFKARWQPGSDSKFEFALALFAGLIVFNLFSECVNRAPGLVLSNASYVKKIVFPLEILPCIAMGSALFHGFVSLFVWLIGYILVYGTPHPTVLLIPLVMMPLLLMTMGFSWLLAALGVYLRDVTHVVGIITTTMMFLSPLFYPVSALPTQMQPFFFLNPLTPAMEHARDVLVWGKLPNWTTLGLQFVVAALIAWLGFVWFQKTRRGFADVI